MTIQQELETLIRARYPLIYIVSSEESRVQEFISQIAQRRQKMLIEWSATTGLLPTGTSLQSQRSRSSPTRDPLKALDEVIDQIEPAIFLFKDFHHYLGRTEPLVVRRLKELALHLKDSYKTIILLSPVLEIPMDLEKEITVVNFPLPTVEDLGQLLDRIVDELREAPGVTVDLDLTSRERLLQAALGLTLGEAENVFARMVVLKQRLSAEDVAEVAAQKEQIIRKNGLLDYCPTDESFAQVGGLALLKDWLHKRSIAFSTEARAFGLPAPKGIFLLGVQGCGKSLCAKAVSSLWQLPLLRFDMGRMFGSYVGSSEENIRRAIAVAESVAPVILWVDEIDKALAGSQGSGSTDAGTTARVFGTFLTWLSEKSAPVFVVATANDITHLPPELLRKGRFDEIFFVDLPSPAEREEVFRIHLERRGREPSRFDLPALVGASQSFSGAEIEEAIISALYDAFSQQEPLHTGHILNALGETVPLSRTMDEHIARLREWAAGRARNASAPVSVVRRAAME
jgi:hypothetical protein